MQVALQATHIGRFKGAEFTPEGLVVAVVRLHMSVQAGDEKTNKQTNKRGHEIRGKKEIFEDKRTADEDRKWHEWGGWEEDCKRTLLYSFHFDDCSSESSFSVFLFCLHQHPKRSTLFTSQTTATHSRWLQSRGAVGVNSSTHNPLPPPRWKLSARVPVGTAAVFLMPASEVAWECSRFLGQGTYSTEGLHLGAQRRWGLTLSLFLILGCGSVWWIKQIARAKLLVSLQCLPVAPRRQEILEKIEDSKGFWKGKQSTVCKKKKPKKKKNGFNAAAGVDWFMTCRGCILYIPFVFDLQPETNETINAPLVLQTLVAAKLISRKQEL